MKTDAQAREISCDKVESSKNRTCFPARGVDLFPKLIQSLLFPVRPSQFRYPFLFSSPKPAVGSLRGGRKAPHWGTGKRILYSLTPDKWRLTNAVVRLP